MLFRSNSAPTITIDNPDANINTSVTALALQPFYVVTDQLNVYKCLGNNNGGVSTIKPSSTSPANTTPAAETDGYIWKYMYTISDADSDKFLTTNWMPVKTLTSTDDGSNQWDVQTNALAGSAPYHGSDPEKELGGTNLMLKARVAGNEGGVILDTNNYSQISLVAHPIVSRSVYNPQNAGHSTNDYITLSASHDLTDINAPHYPSVGKNIVILSGVGKGQIRVIYTFDPLTRIVEIDEDEPWDVVPDTSSVYGIEANASAVNQCSVLTITGESGAFNQDSQLTQAGSGTIGNIVYYDSTVKKVYATNFGYDTSSVTTDSGGSASVSSVVPSAFNPNYGTVLYLENRKSVSRGVDQIEDVRVVIQY